MKTIIRNETEKQTFIDNIQGTEIKSNYRAEFTQVKRKRSLSQNNYMWLILTHAEHETGNNKNDLYSFFLDEHPLFEQKQILGTSRNIQLTSSQFNTTQMTRFIDKIRTDLALVGVETPDADSEQAVMMFNYYRDRGLI